MARSVVTREQWLDLGLVRFGEAGLAGLKVEAMARDLGTSKAGFYWYFTSRQDFEQALFAYWRETETLRIITIAETATSPARKILVLFSEAVHLRQSSDFVFHLRRLGRKRKAAARLLEDTENQRLAYLAQVLIELGKSEREAAEVAERIYHFYLGWS